MATHITLRGDKEEAFRRIKETMGPPEVEPSNPEVVMRLIEVYGAEPNGTVPGGLSR